MAVSWETVRVFISSTFRDMQAERDYLARFVFPKLREELLKRRIHLIDVDLRWGVTSDQDAVSVCREVIDECRPRFMGMLGGRYGWIPKGHECSITEEEVHYGVLERDAEIWGNAFFYFRNEESTASIVEETPGDFREPTGSENARKLADLKQSIVDARLPVFLYGATWDVQKKWLTGLKAFGDQVFADLLQNIQDDPELDDHFAASTETLVSEFAEEREAMEAFVEDRTERYVVGSRQPLLDKMTTFAAASSEQNILIIEGEPGSGKSALLGKFCQLLASRPHDVLISHFVGASVGSTDLRRTLRRLCHELAATVNNIDPLPKDASTSELIDRFRTLLGEVAVRQRVTLIIDAINQFDATDGAHHMDWLPLALPPNVRVIASSINHPALDALRKRSEPVRIEKLESLREEDAQAIIEAFLQRYSKRFSAEQISALLAKTESRLPLYVLIALQELRTLGTYEEITARIEELPDEAKALFRWILKKRLSYDPGFRDADNKLCGAALVAKFASYLGVSRYGLSQGELIGLIDPEDRQGNVAALLRLLRPYLMYRGEMLDFFHSQLCEAVVDEYLGGAGRSGAHQRLGEYFIQTARVAHERKWDTEIQHCFSEMLFHLQSAGMWDDIIAILRDPRMFQHLPPRAYGVDFDRGTYFGAETGSLDPGLLGTLPAPRRLEIGFGIAEEFLAEARRRIDTTNQFEQPWPATANHLRESDPSGFARFRDTFYSFTRIAGLAAKWAAAGFVDSQAGRARLQAFEERQRGFGVSSFLHYLHHFGSGGTGLSHALEDDAYPAFHAWEELRRLSGLPCD